MYQQLKEAVKVARGFLATTPVADMPKTAAAHIEGLAKMLEEALEREVEQTRKLQAFNAHKDGEKSGTATHYWQGDGEDHLESLCSGVPVVIEAQTLRELLQSNGDGSKAEPIGYVCPEYLNDLSGDKSHLCCTISANKRNVSHIIYNVPVYLGPAPTAQDSKVPEGLTELSALKWLHEHFPAPASSARVNSFMLGWNECRKAMLSAAPVPAQDNGKPFDPGTLGFLLEYIGQGDPEVIDGDTYEFLGETEEGLSGAYTHSITDLCHQAAEALRAQDSKVPEILELAWYHKLPAEEDGEEDDYEIFSFKSDECSDCVEVAIVRMDHSAAPVPEKN